MTTYEGPKPIVSVVMPCLNAAALVETAVNSVLGQTLREVELIVVDDGSTDGSAEMLSRLAANANGRLTLLRSARIGPFPARNLALGHAKGEFVAFLDADDYWDVRCLELLLKAATEHGADLTYCGWQNVGPNAAATEPYVPPTYEEGDAVETFLRECPLPIHAALVRRSVLESVGGFSERMFSAMDYDLWLRLLPVVCKMVRVPEVLAFYRWHGAGQISATRWRQTLNAWQVRREFVAANPGMVTHLSSDRLHQLVDGVLLRAGYACYWRRDLEGAQQLFRKAFATRAWERKDLKYLLPAWLPLSLFRTLVVAADKVGKR